jgi:hypothetical protein
VLSVCGNGSDWTLDVEFHDADSLKKNGTFHDLPL